MATIYIVTFSVADVFLLSKGVAKREKILKFLIYSNSCRT